jgi:hypothetical protein
MHERNRVANSGYTALDDCRKPEKVQDMNIEIRVGGIKLNLNYYNNNNSVT